MMFYDLLQLRYWIYDFELFEHLLSCILLLFRVISLQYWSIIWFLMFWNRQSLHSLAILWLPSEEMLLVQVGHLVDVGCISNILFNCGAQSNLFSSRWCCGECIHKSREEIRIRGDENCWRSKQCNGFRWNYFWGKNYLFIISSHLAKE